jgi:hypothetical protein
LLLRRLTAAPLLPPPPVFLLVGEIARTCDGKVPRALTENPYGLLILKGLSDVARKYRKDQKRPQTRLEENEMSTFSHGIWTII